MRQILTSIENSTPPIGDPKATATPAALEAVTISLILTVFSTQQDNRLEIQELAMTPIVSTEKPRHDVPKTARHMDRRTFLPD